MTSLTQRLHSIISCADEDPAEAMISPDEAYTILSNERRRHVLEFIVGQENERIAVSTIADHLSEEWGDSRQSAYVSMTQRHMRKMDAAGLLVYDDRAKTVEVRPAAEQLLSAHRGFRDALR